MTENFFKEVSHAFVTDCPPIYAVGVDDVERVFVAAKFYESYYPKMPAGQRNRGCSWAGVYELSDERGYCTLKPVKEYRYLQSALETFKSLAHEKDWQCAFDDKQLKKLLKKISVENFMEQSS